jgi:FkbM family methyltransferase
MIFKNIFRKTSTRESEILFPLNYLTSNFQHLTNLSDSGSMLDLGDDLIVNEIKKGTWEKGSVYFWTKICTSFKFDNIYDIGAYSGIYGILAHHSRRGSPKIRFIEANPFVYNRLVINLRLNKINTISAKWTAISELLDSTIELSCRLSPSEISTASRADSVHNDEGYKVVCPNDNIEHFCMAMKGTMLTKIDIEGAEVELVNGLLRQYENSTLVCLVEILTEKNFKKIVKIASKYGFSLFSINEKDNSLGALFGYRESSEDRNYLLFSDKATSIYRVII